MSSFVRHTGYVLRNNPITAAAFVGFFMLVACALLGPSLVPYDPLSTGVGAALSAPSSAHWFGTDHVGRDILSRVVVAAQLDVAICLSAVFLSMVVGIALGCVAGYYGGLLDRVIGRVVDTIMAFPLFVLAMGIVAALGNTVANVVFATALVNVPFYVRLARAEVAIRRNAEFVSAAVLSGNSTARIIGRHLLPNVLPPLMVQMSLNLGWAVLNAAGLSFIGLGVRAPAAEWGIMVAEGAQYVISGQWWVCLYPGLALIMAVLCFNFIGDGLRDIVDPRQRS